MRQRKYILIRTQGKLRYSEPTIELRFGYPIYHRDLIKRNESQRDVLGGGQWDINEQGDIVLFGHSYDFGKPDNKDLKEAIKNFNDWDHLEWICEHIYDKEITFSKRII